jgi:diadenosine tetraphosphate (Ap4A) HIT family hydrolase
MPAMPENAQDLYKRSVNALRTPPVAEWDTWPFNDDIRPRTLEAPAAEPPRDGEGGLGCDGCTKPDADYLWTDERWRLTAFGPSGLPVVIVLEPRAHYDTPGELPDELAREMGVMLGRVERAVMTVDGIERVHIGRYGEGAAHLHWWFMGRPTGLRQLASSFAGIWGDVLPPTPEAIWRENIAQVVAAMRAGD